MEKEHIIELIDSSSRIKEKFKSEQVTLFRGYDFKSHTSHQSGMEFEMIYKDSDFISWRDNLCNELSQLKEDDLILDIIRLLNGFKGWGDKTRFDNLENQLKKLKDHISEYVIDANDSVVADERVPENLLVDKISRAVIKLQKNHNYNSYSSEDTMNDFIRDILDESFSIKDQTRQGESQAGNDAGEVDIQVCNKGLPVVMIEALILDSLRKNYFSEHIDKVLTKYDPNGCPYSVVLIYATVVNFENFCTKVANYLEQYTFPFERICDIENISTGYTEFRHFQTVLNRSGQSIRMHFFVAHIV